MICFGALAKDRMSRIGCIRPHCTEAAGSVGGFEQQKYAFIWEMYTSGGYLKRPGLSTMRSVSTGLSVVYAVLPTLGRQVEASRKYVCLEGKSGPGRIFVVVHLFSPTRELATQGGRPQLPNQKFFIVWAAPDQGPGLRYTVDEFVFRVGIFGLSYGEGPPVVSF